MPTRFVLGRASAGKTQHCIDQIVDAARADPLGPTIFFVVPRQATFAVQRRLACGGALSGFCRIRVVSFDLLAETILAECGGEAVPTITPRGRRMIVTYLLRQLAGKLRVYRDSAGRVGLADELDTTFSELEHNGYGAAHLSDALEQLAAENPPSQSPAALLMEKLADLRLIYDAYQAFLGQDRVDPHRRLQQVLDAAGRASSIAASQVFIDGFLGFSDFERQLIATLAGACSAVTITMLIDPAAAVVVDPDRLPDEFTPLHRTELAYRKLYFALRQRDIALDPPLKLVGGAKPRSQPLGALERAFAGMPTGSADAGAAAIELLQLPTRRDEVDAAAATVRRWMRTGLRPREIAVLCRGLGDYHDLIESTFAEYAIPFFADRRRPASHHPLLQTIRAMLLAARHNCPHEAMMTLAKAQLFAIDRLDADRLENYALEHHIDGAGWLSDEPWRFATFRADDDDHPPPPPDDCDALRRKLTAPLATLMERLASPAARPLRDFAGAVMQALQLSGAPLRIAQWIEDGEAAEQFEAAAEHQQVWAQWIELVDEMVELLGDESFTPDEFVEMVETSLAGFDLAIAPATLDQVIVGEFERTRYEQFRGVVLLGWQDGSFPRAAGESSVLGDGERRDLQRRRVELESNAQRKLLDESLLAYLAVTRAREMLCITRILADDSNRPLAPSPYWRQVQRVLGRDTGDEKEIPLPSAISPFSTPRKTVEALARWAREKEDVSSDAAALYQSLAANAPPAIGRLITSAWPALSYANHATLSPARVHALFGDELRASVSQIEAFASCPYRHFAKYTLRLALRPEPDVSQLDLGTLYHRVLEELVGRQISQRRGWDRSQRPTRDEIAAAAELVSRELRSQIMLASSRNKFLAAQMQRRIDEVLDHQHAAGAAGRLEPAYVELTFGFDDSSLKPLKLPTPKKREVILRGKIDRVDAQRDSATLAVFDYKARHDKLALDEVYHGLALQLLTYLLVLQANGQTLFGRKPTPIAAFYVRLMRSLATIKHPSELSDPESDEFALRTKIRGIFHVDHVHLIDADTGDAGYKSPIVQFGTKKDGEARADGDDATSAEFEALLGHVRQKIVSMADQIMDGMIEIHPYRLGNSTPCSRCEYRPLCRFDPAEGGRYLDIATLKPQQVHELLRRGGVR